MKMRVLATIGFVFGALMMVAGPAGAQGATLLKLSTPAFKPNDAIPAKYTCDGAGVNPPLVFSGVPANTKQLVFTVHDRDVPLNLSPTGNFDHWLVWDLPATSKGIAEGAGATLGVNGTGKPGYLGPCPPDKEHRYFFRLYAIDISLAGRTFKNRDELLAAMKGHILQQNDLMARYDKIKK